jgi:hypothetical protein
MHALTYLSTLLLAVPTPQTPPAYMMEVQPTKRVEAVMTLELNTPNAKVADWVLVVPRLPELPGQSNVKSKTNYPSENITDFSPLKRPLLRVRLKVGKNKDLETKVTLVTTYEAQLQSRKLVPVPEGTKPPKVAPLPAADRKLYVAKTEFMNYDSLDFKTWLKDNKLERGASERDVDYGQRVFQFMVKGLQYEYLLKMDRTATGVCKAGKSDCSGLSVLFAAAMRAHDIPCRLRVGRWAESANKGEVVGEVSYAQQHTWTEFFCNGIGWVPSDPTVGVLYEKFKGKDSSAEWFGYDHGKFLTLHLDHHLIIDSVLYGKQTEPWMTTGGYWMNGTGTIEGGSIKDDWQVKELK